MTDWMVSLQEQLERITDKRTASHVITRLLPNMLADMNNMSKSRRIGDSVSEEYKLDDGSLSVILTGVVTEQGLKITNVTCG